MYLYSIFYWIVIVENLIFDSNQHSSLMLTKYNLNMCCLGGVCRYFTTCLEVMNSYLVVPPLRVCNSTKLGCSMVCKLGCAIHAPLKVCSKRAEFVLKRVEFENWGVQ